MYFLLNRRAVSSPTGSITLSLSLILRSAGNVSSRQRFRDMTGGEIHHISSFYDLCDMRPRRMFLTVMRVDVLRESHRDLLVGGHPARGRGAY